MVRKEFVETNNPNITLEVVKNNNGIELCINVHGNPYSIILDSDDVLELITELNKIK